MNPLIHSMLKSLNLTKYELECYDCILEIGTLEAKEICKETSIPYGRIYDILQQLSEKGLISILPTKPKTFKLIDPSLSFSLVLEKREEEIQQLKKSLLNIKFVQPKLSKKKEETIVIKGKEQQFEMAKHFYKSVNNELLSISRNFNPDVSYKIAIRHAIQRKANIKIIIKAQSPENKQFIKECLNENIQFRQKELSGLRLLIKDNEEMLLSIVDPDTNERFSIYTSNKEFVSSMATFFNTLWATCKQLKKKEL